MTERWERIIAVAGQELRVQRREPLTVLYMLVFALLAMAFAATGPVELVRDRGAVPRDAPWSLMLASTAITAFGQVITTMVAATVVLRDRADRVADLLVTSRLTEREYRFGKLLAALLLLTVIYAAIPLGLTAGAMLGGGSIRAAWTGSLLPFVGVVLPTMLAIGALQFAAGVLSGRLWVIVGQGLVLIWLWTAAIDVVTRGGGLLPTLLDPFGSAPLLHATRSWSDAERLVRAMPVTPATIAGRGLWLVVGAAAAWLAIVHRSPRRPRAASERASTASVARPVIGAPVRAPAPRWGVGVTATARYVFRWMVRDPGWRVLAGLGAVNVGLRAAGATPGIPADAQALAILQEHARLFLILLATIYAGELVWREREERSAPLFDGLPIPRRAVVIGRIAGVIVAQGALVSLLVVTAMLGVRAGAGSIPGQLPIEALGGVLLPFVSWMLLSLAVHVLVGNKVVAHLLCIAGWALASVRFGAAGPGGGSMPVAVWLAMCLLGGCVVLLAWREDATGRRQDRRPGMSRSLS